MNVNGILAVITILITSCGNEDDNPQNMLPDNDDHTYKFVDSKEGCKIERKLVKFLHEIEFDDPTETPIERSRKQKFYDSFNFLLESWGDAKKYSLTATCINIVHDSLDTTSSSILEVRAVALRENVVSFGSEYLIKELYKVDNVYKMKVCAEVSGIWDVHLSKDSCIMSQSGGKNKICYYIEK